MKRAELVKMVEDAKAILRQQHQQMEQLKANIEAQGGGIQFGEYLLSKWPEESAGEPDPERNPSDSKQEQ